MSDNPPSWRPASPGEPPGPAADDAGPESSEPPAPADGATTEGGVSPWARRGVEAGPARPLFEPPAVPPPAGEPFELPPITGSGYEAPGWQELPPPFPGLAPAARPEPRRAAPVVLAAVVGAVVGALTAGLLVVAFDDEESTAGGPVATYSANTSRIARPADIQEILARVQPAVVAIRTRTLNLGELLRPVPGEGAGTGFVLTPDGLIVTNAHVISGAQSIDVVFGNDRTMPARVLGRDASVDLAVLKVEASGLSPAALGDSERLRVGDDVVAIGNALALEGGPTVTRGIVSAKDRTITAENGVSLEHLIQTDTAINPGNSGGPLVNSAGEVVGINTAVAGDAQNIGFSIAINEAKPIIEELRQGTAKSRPFLGVQMYDVDPSVAEQLDLTVEEGALVAAVTEGSGAEVGGIRRLDVIVEIDGQKIAEAEDVTSVVRTKKPGDEIAVTVVRDGERQTFTVRLGERPADVG